MISILIGASGILITLIFGGYQIWVYKKSKRKVSLEFKNKECYSLFQEDVNRLNVEIIYNKTPLNNTLILLKATLKNNGHIDIDQNRVYAPLKIKSSEAYNWLEATITSSPKGASTNIQLVDGQKIELTWDLLKQNESIEIEALVEITGELKKGVEKGTDFFNNLFFDYRITDLDSVQKVGQISKSNKLKTYTKIINTYLSVLSIAVGIVFLSIGFFPDSNILDQHIVNYAINRNNQELVSVIWSNNPEEITLKIEGEGKHKISVEDFNNTYEIDGIKKTTIDPVVRTSSRLIGIVYLTLGVFVIILKWKRRKRLNATSEAGIKNLENRNSSS